MLVLRQNSDTLTICCIPTGVSFMKQNVVELERQLKQATSEKEKLDALLALAAHNSEEDFIEGWRFGQEALELSKIMLNPAAEARAHEAIAGCLWKLSDYTVS